MSGKRPKRASRGAARRPSEPSTTAWAAVPRPLRAFCELGLRVRREVDRGRPKKAAARAVAGRVGCEPDKALKALACVERITREELVRLGAMTTRTGEPLSVNHLRR